MSANTIITKRLLGLLAALFVTGAASAAVVPAAPDLEACKTEYPRAALVNDEEGKVSMNVLVTARGEVKDARVEKSSGYRALDRAAAKKLASCKFTPGTKDGAPADTWTRVDYAWKLD